MTYNPEIPITKYDNAGDNEWIRLEKDSHGILLYEVHLDILKRHIQPTDRVLEIGAGSGRYTKDIVHMAKNLTVADISKHQLKYNQQKMQELGLTKNIDEFKQLDMVDLSIISDNTYDNVVCIGGPVNYLLDKEKQGISEMLRILKSGGKLILGSMSLLGATFHYMEGIWQEKHLYGIEGTKWILDTGMQDGINYPVASKHYVHMMKSSELDAIFSEFDVTVVERSSAGLFTLASSAGEDTLDRIREEDDELWQLILQKELEFTKYPGTLDCGMNLIYVVEKK